MNKLVDTDVPNYKLAAPGVVLHTDDEAYNAYLRQSSIFKKKASENIELEGKINSLTAEVEALKNLVLQLISKG